MWTAPKDFESVVSGVTSRHTRADDDQKRYALAGPVGYLRTLLLHASPLPASGQGEPLQLRAKFIGKVDLSTTTLSHDLCSEPVNK